MRAWQVALLAGLSLAAPTAVALELCDAAASRDGRRFVLAIDAWLAASPERVLAVLTDYEHLPDLHPSMLGSRVLARPASGVAEVATEFRNCILLFCRTVRRVERIRATERGLSARDLPGRGSFSAGRTEWGLQAAGAGTRLTWRAEITPDFWVPPFFGDAMLGKLQRTTEEMLAAVETRAGQDGG
jgi:carbon monoxide dehydrogenase subunit G